MLDFEDDAYWSAWRGVYQPGGFYVGALERWRDRFVEAVRVVAHAEPAVLVHCVAGRDRTGLVSALVLSVAGVPPEEIASDYALSRERLQPLYDEWIAAADEPERARLERENVSAPETILRVLEQVDAEEYLRDGGLAAEDVEAIRTRLVG